MEAGHAPGIADRVSGRLPEDHAATSGIHAVGAGQAACHSTGRLSPSPVVPPLDAKPTGRVSFDSRGQAFWEWEISPGVFTRDPDTDPIAALDAESPLSLEEPSDTARAKFAPGKASAPGDPRNQVTAPSPSAATPRKSLDDLRRLSEEIKRARHWQPPAKK